jgi:MFS family permease
LFQFWISRRIRLQPPFLTMAIGAVVFAVGVFLYGIVTGFVMFVLAAIVVCFGEMVYFPTSQVVTAGFAPREMRGRYMAIAGYIVSIPNILGPAAAGYILDNFNPDMLWYLGGLLCLGSALGYVALHSRLGREERFAPAAPEKKPANA